MKYSQFGSTGLKVSRLGIGSLAVGPSAEDAACVTRIMNQLLDAGANLIDTAQCYARSEELIGRELAHRRHDYILVSKCGHHQILPDKSMRSLTIGMEDIEMALRKLNTDYLDVMLLHSYDYDLLQKGDALEVLRKARDEGKIRFFGYSGDNERALWAVVHGGVDVVEMSISLCDQYNLNNVIPECLKHTTAVIAKRPVGNAAWRFAHCPQDANPHHQEYASRFQALAFQPGEYGCNTMAELALRFVTSLDGVNCAIVSSRSPEHISDNLRIIDGEMLSSDAIAKARARFMAVQKNWAGCN